MDGTSRPETADRACAWCKKNKRRCDKSLPGCSLCTRYGQPLKEFYTNRRLNSDIDRMGRECDYSDQSPRDPQIRIQELEELVARLMNQSQTPSSTTSYESVVATLANDPAHSYSHRFFLRSIFLDSGVSTFLNAPIIASDTPIPREVSETLGSRLEIDLIISYYSETVNTWMPIINISRLERLIGMASTEMRSDLALLLLSIRLIQHVPASDDAEQSPLYIAAKKFCFALEMGGTCSLLKVQASLLIAIYELGHAIFPAAYTSIGACARQGISLGIHKRDAPQILRKPRTWIDWEERQRVWWLIVILDRYANRLCLREYVIDCHLI